MQLSYNGLKLIESSEGLKLVAYRDGGGVWTIGYGTTMINGKPVQEGMTCTAQQADSYLAADTAAAQTAINQSVKVPLSQNQFDALVSLVYNIGVGAFQKSTILRLINLRDPAASAEFDKWCRDGGKIVPGLVARRARERSLYETR